MDRILKLHLDDRLDVLLGHVNFLCQSESNSRRPQKIPGRLEMKRRWQKPSRTISGGEFAMKTVGFHQENIGVSSSNIGIDHQK